MKRKIAIISTLVLLTATYSFANEDGKNKYEEANCHKCHGMGDNFDAKNNKAKSLYNLQTWTHNCAKHFKLDWDAFDEEEVVDYLNKTHYKF